MRTYCIAYENLLSALWWCKWEGNPKRGVVCPHMADSLCYTAENNTVKQLYANKIFLWKDLNLKHSEFLHVTVKQTLKIILTFLCGL